MDWHDNRAGNLGTSSRQNVSLCGTVGENSVRKQTLSTGLCCESVIASRLDLLYSMVDMIAVAELMAHGMSNHTASATRPHGRRMFSMPR